VGATLLDRVDQPPPNGDGPRRRIDRRVPLPGGRAVVGGLLVALAAVGVFAAWTGATDEPTRPVVVARGDVRPGDVLDPADLEVRELDIPDALASSAYSDPAGLVGAVAVAPLAEGDLVQHSAVVERAAGAEGAAAELSFAIDSDRAVDGRLQVGERVDVLATFGTGIDAETEVVVQGAQVLSATRDDRGVGAVRLVLTLGLDGDDVVALTHAVRAGEVTVVRTAG